MSRRFITPDLLTHIRGSMNDHEWAVLRDVAATRLATATQLQTLNALRIDMDVRRFRRLLKRLHEQDVLFRLERTVGGKKFGSAAFVYGVGVVGQRLLGMQPRRPWTPRPSWLAHALQTTSLYVQLRTAEHSRQLTLTRFEAEPECWRNYRGPGGGTIDIKPDAYVEVEVGDYLDRYFVEVDMATESPTTLRNKADAYAAYRLSGHEQTRTGAFPLVLWLVPDDHRRLVVQKVIARQADEVGLHDVATFDRATQVFIEEPP